MGAARALGSSVPGPRHRAQGLPNADAVLTGRVRQTLFAVVCDGVGDRPHAAIGARAACRAVRDALRHWEAAGDAGAEPLGLLRLIHQLWAIRMHPHALAAGATTCLFAALLPGGRVVHAQLGDGLVAHARPDGRLDVLGSRQDRFGQLAAALGKVRALDAWQTGELAALSPGSVLILASDGVADDLVPGQEGVFAQRLVSTIAPLPPNEGRRRLTTMLEQWPTPHHLDDKTVALLWRTMMPNTLPTSP